jgi:hypothetical protein
MIQLLGKEDVNRNSPCSHWAQAILQTSIKFSASSAHRLSYSDSTRTGVQRVNDSSPMFRKEHGAVGRRSAEKIVSVVEVEDVVVDHFDCENLAPFLVCPIQHLQSHPRVSV